MIPNEKNPYINKPSTNGLFSRGIQRGYLILPYLLSCSVIHVRTIVSTIPKNQITLMYISIYLNMSLINAMIKLTDNTMNIRPAAHITAAVI